MTNHLILVGLLTVNLALPIKHFVSAPVAKAGYTFHTTKQGGLLVTLDGSGSIDPDGFIVKYEWTQVGTNPNAARIYDPNGSTTIVAPAYWVLGVYKFQLEVTDNQGVTNSTIVTVTVVNGG